MNQVIAQKILPGERTLQLVQGDLTQEKVDAIVNAANEHLSHGAGIAAAISSKGGPVIDRESQAWVQAHGPVACDSPAYTSAGKLPCRFVIHAVGPIWGEGKEDSKLTCAVQSALALAGKLELASISIPAISTGIFGFPKDRAARLILKAVEDYFPQNPASPLRQVRVVLYDEPTLTAFRKAWGAAQRP